MSNVLPLTARPGDPPILVGVIHVSALPGTPRSSDSVEALIDAAVTDARVYHAAGFDALIVENMHDRPYRRGTAGPEIVAAMTRVGAAVRQAAPLPLGIQVLAAANREAVAVALAVGASFVRVEGFVFAHVADEGVIEASAGDLLRYRRHIGAGHVRILADIKKKHSAHAITADVDLVETARAAEFFLADGLIVTGPATGRPTAPAEVHAVAEAVDLPVFVGSGVTADDVAGFHGAAGFIVGTSAKREGAWTNEVDPSRASALVRAVHRAFPRR